MLLKYLKVFIILFLTGFIFVNFAHARVRFITDEGERETFKSSSSCPNSYIACVSPKIGVGTVCDGKYASCQCSSTYAACESPKTGENAVGCDGKFLSSDCQCPSDYDTVCNGTNNIVAAGAVSCDGKYKAEDCKCPSGWFTSSTCVSPKELGGGTCNAKEINGLITSYVTYRETCTCPSKYLTCTNGGEIGASSCTDSSGTKYTSCKSDNCPADMVDVNIYWGGKLKYIMDTTKGIQVVGTKKCIKLPTCESFGYGAAAECANQTYLKCPFDNTKVYCPDMMDIEPIEVPTCTSLGYDEYQMSILDIECKVINTSIGKCSECSQGYCQDICSNSCSLVAAGVCRTSCQTSCSKSGSWAGDLTPPQYDSQGNQISCFIPATCEDGPFCIDYGYLPKQPDGKLCKIKEISGNNANNKKKCFVCS